eukprot:CAMPEP_0196994854 /NCGR_PEP_ID=MMETSP1380-20130617/1085_1 /TAXON_ID=5936 /ORGANISM="Euplotes crassus, Strain CT5" /LENGTH=103 /DNA_ID=CAMNT_0042410345 /DNA_START=33 /DNA_END=344 /DNA_ORIENTATION=-
MGEYNSGLCSCFDDCGICCIAYCIPCYQVGKNVGDAEGQGVNWLWVLISCLFAPCAIFYSRTKVQEKYQIEENVVSRILFSFCCALCALSQDARELKKQGAAK